MARWSAIEWLQVAERELLFFALFWFVLGTLDEAAIDLAYLWLRLTGRARTPRLAADPPPTPLTAAIAVLIPAWRETRVIGATIAHLLGAWPQASLRLYVGCYRNDPGTLAAAVVAAPADPRLRLVVHGVEGPTTKADCLNRLYAAMAADEARTATRFGGIVLHDAEDMVHPLALGLIDRALATCDFVQLPVRPELPRRGRWIAGHYADEFAESHAKALVVRGALGAGLPAAGVGCGFARHVVGRVAEARGGSAEAPFAADCLTEDYEMGLGVRRLGGAARFLRMRDAAGALIATRSFFPARLDEAVRQNTRWIHGIALQACDRLGWDTRPVELWMALRDRRGPLTALVLASGYALLAVEALLWLAGRHGTHWVVPAGTGLLVDIAVTGCIWRAASRALFTAREYGAAEGLAAIARIPIANVIAMIAGRRALFAYARALWSGRVVWDKTRHRDHPVLALGRRAA